MSKKMSKAEQKKKLRSAYLKKRNEMDSEKRRECSEKIRERLRRSKRLKTASTVFVYAAYKSEVETQKIMSDLLKMGKRVAVPKVNGEEMDFYEIQSWEELFPGFQGILEPQGADKEPVIPEDSDVMLLPGAVYDRRGGRIGYGGGYYDRYLKKIKDTYGKEPYLMALCFQSQLYPGKLPSEEHDRKMDCVLTEKSIIAPKGDKNGKINGVMDIIEIVIEFVIDIVLDFVVELID